MRNEPKHHAGEQKVPFLDGTCGAGAGGRTYGVKEKVLGLVYRTRSAEGVLLSRILVSLTYFT